MSPDTRNAMTRLARRSPAGTAGERFPPGTVLAGRYRIAHAIGRGGMGEVYRADDTKLGVAVALKLLPAEYTQDEELLSLLLNEARLARSITHQNVCRIHDVAESGGLHFISMELVTGEDLASLLRRIGRLPQGKAVDVARGLCAGLDAAHGQGVLHRDLKPANVMIDERGEVRITDFGLSLHLGSTAAAGSAPTGTVAGTPAYMAPEQLSGGQVSIRTDLYALGLVLYEVFTGRQTFEASTTEEVIRLQCEATPPSPASFVSELDPAIEQIILRCLEKDPGARPASAQAVAAALPGRSELATGTVLKTLLACEIEPAQRYEEAMAALLREHAGHEVGTARESGRHLLVFGRPIHAVLFARACHEALAQLSGGSKARLAVHLGEVTLRRPAAGGSVVEGPGKDLAERLARLADPAQTLLSRAAFDVARRSAIDEPGLVRNLSWLAHGRYVFQGFTEPVEVFEVGDRRWAPLKRPGDSETASRVLGEDVVLGWRPAPGLALPGREHWAIDRKIGEGGFGEVWLARHEKTRERRVYKFCYEPSRLKSLQREITLFRLLKEELGERDDIARILDWNFDEAPYFIESEYTVGGDLGEWTAARGGMEQVPLAERLEIVSQVAEALAAAHSVGVLHKDVKPSNILVWRDAEGRIRARLTDFGIGAVTDPDRLAAAGITLLGMSEVTREQTSSSPGGTRLYMAPELLEGKSATLQADIYALGVVLYQMVVGDLRRALAPGWQRELDDEMLREDIAAAVDGSADRRLSSAAELARRLRTLEARRLEREAEAELHEALARFRRRRRWAIYAAAILAVFALVVGRLLVQVRREAQAARDLARAAVAANLLAEGESTLGNLVALEVRDPAATRTAVATLKKALAEPVELVAFPATQARVLPDSWDTGGQRVLALAAAPDADFALRVYDARTGKELRRLEGHTARIHAAAWNGDSTRIATAAADATARIWDLTSGGSLSLEGHSGSVQAVAWSGDARYVATGSADGTARSWDARTGAERVRFEGHSDRLLSVAWNGDDSRLLTVSADHTARVWDARNGKELLRLGDAESWVRTAVWSGDGRRIATAADQKVRIWDARTGREVLRLPEHKNRIHNVAWDADSHRLLTASLEAIRIWDADTGEERSSLFGHMVGFRSTAWSADGRRILTSSADATARIWDAETGEELVRMSDPSSGLQSASFSPDGGRVLTLTWDAAARIWNVRTGEELPRLVGHDGAVHSAMWSGDGRRVVTASEDTTARVWDATTGREELRLRGHEREVLSASWNGDGSRILTASFDKTARIWDAASGKELVRLEGHDDSVSSALWSGDSTRVLTSSWDRTARIWDAASGAELVRLQGHADIVWSAAWDPEDRRVATTSIDKTARIWDAASGKELARLEGHHGSVYAVAWSDDGSRVVTASEDATARIWDAASGRETVRLDGHTGTIWSVSWSGSRVVTASEDRTARIWDAETGMELAVFDGHTDAVLRALPNAGGAWILTASRDGTARIWDAGTGAERVKLSGHRGAVLFASWNGRRVLTASADRTARIWVVDDEDASYLRGRVRARTSSCLPAKFRMEQLGEAAEKARQAFEDCERCFPRFNRSLEKDPVPTWESYAEAWREYERCLYP